VIEYVRGTVSSIAVDHAVVDVSGIGLRVQAAPPTLADLREGQGHEIPTALVVREDSWTLYGFSSEDERELFNIVQTVSGIGPRTAQALIAALSGPGVRQAVTAGDEKTLTKAPGIGRKGAQRLILELGDRLGPVTPTGPETDTHVFGGADGPTWREDVHAGLMTLGWSAREVTAAIDAAIVRMGEEPGVDSTAMPVSDAMRLVLRELNRS
jgi:Holliday junction DNA helicase RuvA